MGGPAVTTSRGKACHVRQLAAIGAARPRHRDADLTLEKSIGLGGSRRLDVRIEAYNLFNRANFNIPGFTLGAADFGVVSSARAARTVQLGTRVSF